MATGAAKRHMNRTRDGQIEIGQAIVPVQLTRKRPRRVTEANNNDEGGGDHEEPGRRCKRLKVHTKSRTPSLPGFEDKSSLRRSTRLQKLRELRDQLGSGEQKRTERSSAAAQYRDWKGAQTQKKASAASHKVKRQGFLKQGSTQGTLLNPSTARRGKRRRNPGTGDELHQVSKRQRRQSVSGLSIERADSIERWLDESYPDQKPSIADKVLEVIDTMPRKSGAALPSPEDSFDRTTISSRKSDRTTASVRDSDYRQSLRHRSVYINHKDPPPELMGRAKRIISRPRLSPEMDDEAAQQLVKTSRRLEDEGEEVLVQQFASAIIPAMKVVPDRRLASNSGLPWSNSVPVPLKPSILTTPLPLPKPKPDLAFGYSHDAFTEDQLGTIGLLVDDQFGRSYAVPDQKLLFPFLNVEFKSQAKNGTHYIATNQAAGTGAVALRGVMDLVDRSFGMESFDYEEPLFFSVTMDHQLACVNVHWLEAPVDGGKHSFHTEGLSRHLLQDVDGIRATARAIKNILDEGTDKRLQTLCGALDAYREIVVRNREAADPQRVRHEAQAKMVPNEASADEPVPDRRRMNRVTRGSLGTPNVRRSKSTAASPPISRHSARSAGNNAYNVAPRRGQPSRHTIAGDQREPKRQVKPSQKVLDNRHHMIDGQGVKPRGSRHEL